MSAQPENSKYGRLPIVWAKNVPVEGHTSGGDGGGPTMETRVAKLESDVSHILTTLTDIKIDQRAFATMIETRLSKLRDDMRTDFYWVIGAFVVMLGVLAKGFHWF